MANRVMQQKRLKMARQRRAWAKEFRQRNFRQPNREVINEYKQRNLGLEVDEAHINALVILQQIKEKDPNPGIPVMVSEERKAVLRRQAELEASIDCDMRVLGPTGRDALQESWIYFNSLKTCFVLLHIDKVDGIERKSTTYSSKELLLMYWEAGQVRWINEK